MRTDFVVVTFTHAPNPVAAVPRGREVTTTADRFVETAWAAAPGLET